MEHNSSPIYSLFITAAATAQLGPEQQPDEDKWKSLITNSFQEGVTAFMDPLLPQKGFLSLPP